MNNGIENDILKAWENFSEMTYSEMDKAIKRGLRKAAMAIKNKTLDNARSGIKTYNNHPDDGYNEDSILDAVRVTKLEDYYATPDELSIKVHVMGRKAKHSQTYRFRFLEKGTKDRYQTELNGIKMKKPRRVGAITPRRFFRDAVGSVDAEKIFEDEVIKAVQNINSGSK